MTGSPSSRQVMTETRQKTILQAALTSFLTRGFTNTTIELIGQLSGASTGSIYHHFANKEMLAMSLYTEGYSELIKTLTASLVDQQPCAGIKAFVCVYLNWFEQNPDLGKYLFQAAYTEYLGEKVNALRQTPSLLVQHLYSWLEPFIAEGQVMNYPKALYVPLVIGPSREFVRRWLREGTPDELQAVRETLAEIAWQALAPHEVAAPASLPDLPE